jgi:hypothetical protein
MNSETRELAGIALQKMEKGAVLSNEEIIAGIEVLNIVVPCLRELGSVYHLAYSSLARILDQFRSFREARKAGDDWSHVSSRKIELGRTHRGIEEPMPLSDYIENIESDQQKLARLKARYSYPQKEE